MIIGSLLAAWMFEDFSWALAGFVGATLAPTDAALSAQVINDERIPMRLRRALNVESGLNDGIATPIVVFTLAVAASQLGTTGHGTSSEGGALLELAVGVLVGLAVGLGSAGVITVGSRRHWIVAGGRRLAALAAALSSFALAVALDGNGFIAAFVAGIAFGSALPADVAEVEDVAELPELLGEVMALAVWFLFGAALVPVALDHFSVSTLVYALLSLTVIRVVPVAVSLLGTGLDRWTVLFVGWFGPEGPGLGRVCPPGTRGAGRVARGRTGHRGGRPHGAAERGAPWSLGRPPREPLRPPGSQGRPSRRAAVATPGTPVRAYRGLNPRARSIRSSSPGLVAPWLWCEDRR